MGSNLIAVAEWSKTRVCGGSLAGVAGLNPAGGMDICVVLCVCCTVEKRDKQGQQGKKDNVKKVKWEGRKSEIQN